MILKYKLFKCFIALLLLDLLEAREYRCDFESDCDTSNEGSIDWIAGKGSLFKGSKVSPRYDHTTGTSAGRYYYAEITGITEDYKLARLVVPEQRASGSLCVSFWYQVSSSSANTISVFKRTNSGREEVKLLEIKGNSSPRSWKKSSVTLNHDGRVEVIFEAKIYRNSFYGSFGNLMAIDDVNIYDESCAGTYYTEQSRVRLQGGSDDTEGRVEVEHDGKWRPICNDGWGVKEAKTICKQLGYNGGRIQNLGDFDSDYDQSKGYWLSDLDCQAGTSLIDDCSHKGWGEHDCGYNQFAKIRCNENDPVDPWSVIKIADAVITGSTIRGRVLIRRSGSWGGICDHGYNNLAGRALCRTLGFRGGYSALPTYVGGYNPGTEHAWINHISCGSFEQDFFKCSKNYEYTQCDLVGLECEFLTSTFPYMADFENGDTGDIMTNTGGNVNWRIETARDVDRSIRDKTNDDSYGYVMATSPRRNGDVVAVTEEFTSTSTLQCLRFSYLFTDEDSPALTIYRKYQRYRDLIWERKTYSGGNTYKWYEVEIDIPASVFSLVLVANGDHDDASGWIVVDDILLTPGNCDGSNNGNEENSNETGGNSDGNNGGNSGNNGGDSGNNNPSVPEVESPPRDRSAFIEENFDSTSSSVFSSESSVIYEVESGSTGSRNTGPDDDHTYPNDDATGAYWHLEATGLSNGDHVQICSIDELGDDTTDRCLEVYRYIKGNKRHMGKLNVYLVEDCNDQTTSGSPSYTDYARKTLLADFDNNDIASMWQSLKVNLYGDLNLNMNHVVIETVRGGGYQGDIAIDDFSVSNGLCCYPDSYSCSFDSNEECCYHDVPENDRSLMWTTEYIPTSGDLQNDRYGNNGNFLWLNHTVDSRNRAVSSPGSCNSIQGPRLPRLPSSANGYELNVWIHMRGRHIGTLEIYASLPHESASNRRLLHTLTGSQDGDSGSNDWKLINVRDINSYDVITFRGCLPDVDSDTYDYIGIDDVEISIVY